MTVRISCVVIVVAAILASLVRRLFNSSLAGLCSSHKSADHQGRQGLDGLFGVVSLGLDHHLRSLRRSQDQQVERALGVDAFVAAQDLDPRLGTCSAVRASMSAGRACSPSGFTMTTVRVTGEVLMTKCS